MNPDERMATVEAQVSGLDAWHIRHESEQRETTQRIFDKLDEIVKQLSGRLPAWATILIGILMGACGWLSGAVW